MQGYKAPISETPIWDAMSQKNIKNALISNKSRKLENLKKVSLIELKEILKRESDILKNIGIIKNLPDKGKAIQEFRDQVEKEIKYREDLEHIEKDINKMSLIDQPNHIQHLCNIEKVLNKERYKPFSTLNKVQEIKPDSKIFNIIEDCTAANRPSKLIPLPESIDILKRQEDRVKEIQVKDRYQRLLTKMKEEEEENESAESTDSREFSEGEGD